MDGSAGDPERAAATGPRAAWDRVALITLAATALALRLAFRIDHDEDLDALRFRLGVERFDVAESRPHAPFYPVYVGAAKLVAWLGASPRGSLAIIGAIAGAAVVVSTALLAFEVLGRRAAYAAGLLALASPFLWLSSEKLLSDMTGVAAVTMGLWLAVRARRIAGEASDGAAARAASLRTAALVVLGLGLGVRLSYFPFAIAIVAIIARAEGGSARAWASRARDLATGAVLWLVPLVVVAKPRPLVTMSLLQATGHFTVWGGSAITVSSPWERLRGIVWGLVANVLACPWPDAPTKRWIVGPLVALLLVAALRATRLRAWLRAHPEIAACALAYVAWAALGQNVAHKPRHLLPLAPLAIVALAAGAEAIARWAEAPPDLTPDAHDATARSFDLKRSLPPSLHPWLARVAVAALTAAWLADGATLAWAHTSLSPAAAAVSFLAAGGGGARPVVSRDRAPMIADGAPARALTFAPGDRALVDAIATAGPEGALVTSETLTRRARRALDARGFDLRVLFAWPRSRYVDSLWTDLAIVEIRPRPAMKQNRPTGPADIDSRFQ